MAAINSVITSALDRAIDRLFDLSAISRYFTTFDPTPQTYISLSSAITVAGDFEMDVLMHSDFVGVYGIVTDLTGANYVRTNGPTVINYKIDGVYGSISGLTLPANKLIVMTIARVGTQGIIRIDGAQIGSLAVPLGDFILEHLGRRSTTDYFNGIIADVKIWDGGDRDTGTLVLDMPIDGSGYGTDPIVDNNQTVLGSESWISGEQTLLTGTQTSALNLGGQTPVYIQLPSDIEVTENGSWIGLGSTSVVITTQYVTFRNNSGSTIVFTPSVKEIPAATPLGTAVNFVDADSEEFTFQDNDDWLAGEELWISGAGVSNGSEGTVQTLITNPAGQTETGKTYQIVNTVTNLTAGGMSSTLKGKGWGYTSDGVYTEIWTATGGGDVVRTGNAQPNSGASLLPSFKRILEAP